MGRAGDETMKDAGDRLDVERSSKAAGRGYEMKPGARVACRVSLVVVVLVLLVTATAFAVQAFQPRIPSCHRCPFNWIGYRGKCYYFSEAEGNWTSSQDSCSLLGASLAVFNSTEDLNFTMRYKGISEHWIGLSRQDEQQPWQWVDGSSSPPPFGIRGGGHCAYLNDNGLSSSWCSTERNWVCTKPELPGPRPSRASRNLCVDS